MSEIFEHKCIKPSCDTKYKDTDPDAYYCNSCNETRKEIAKQVDKKFENKIREPVKSLLQEYDESPKAHGFVITKLS